VRRAAARILSSTPDRNATSLRSLLDDPVREVRIETAEVLADVPSGSLPLELAPSFARNISEYIAAQMLNDDRPEAHLNLGSLFARQGNTKRAENEFKTALVLDPSFAPAAVNLADLYRALGRDNDGEAVLRAALQRTPKDASVLYALGLLMVRKKQTGQAIELLGEAARAAPSNARYTYVYGIALHGGGDDAKAIRVLEASLITHPYDQDSLAAIADFLEQHGETIRAQSYRERLDKLQEDNGAKQVIR
jgi:tetratricopeptide (TPR) repeat protein